MKIQSLSIVVPNKECMNKCPFCVARMVNSNIYENRMSINHPYYDINVREYLKRLRFVADNGCQTIILTGTSEPQQNKQFLGTFALLHQMIGSPFTNIEMQTTGFGLDENRDYLRFLRNFVGVNTVALSISSPISAKNCEILGHPCDEHPVTGKPIPKFRIGQLCDNLKDYDFNIRICFNLTSEFDKYTTWELFDWAKAWHANQITFRKLYASDKETPQGKWIEEHSVSAETLERIKEFLANQPILGKTLYGATCYDVDGMSVMFDDDCMGKNPESDVRKYLILRPNCKLYSQWDSKASLVI